MNDPAISPITLLVVYCALILLASLAGGWIPLFVRLTHTRLQVAISFVSGLMLGVGVLHLMPHAWHQLHSIDKTAMWLLGGFLIMFFVQRFFHFHHHDVPEGSKVGGESHLNQEALNLENDHEHKHAPGCHGHSLAEQSARRLSWTGAAFGLMLHSLMDGVALGASVFVASHSNEEGWLLGAGTFLVIFLHKPFDALAIGTLMARSGGSKASRHVINGLFALGIPLGLLIFHFGAHLFPGATDHFLGIALALAAGTFICIAASDLLPELQFHEHDRIKLSVALIIGLGFAVMLGHFETSGHDHHENHQEIAPTNITPN